jgi:hypothetical protein
VYCVAEDHVNPNLLFCGTEFGLYVTMDSGKKWHRLKNGLPTIQVKDLVIQKANDDLIVGTFGRGIYVIDDFSAMRSVSANPSKGAELFAVKDTIQYVRSAPYGFGTKGFMGESLYTAENPAHGATFTVQIKESPKTLKQKRKDAEKEAEKAKQPIPYPTKDELRAEIEEEPATNTLLILDKEDTIVTRLSCPTGEGVHRVTWYLREAGANPDADQGGYGQLVVPGSYKVQLVQKLNGETKPLTDAVSFLVQPDPLSPLKADDYKEIAAFNKSVKQLQQKLVAVSQNATELSNKIDAMKKSAKLSAKELPDVDKKLFDLSQKLKLLQRDLNGDSTLASRNENVPESIRATVRGAASPNQGAIAKPTGTQKELLASSTKALEEATAKLKTMIEKDAAEIEKALEAAGVGAKLK